MITCIKFLFSIVVGLVTKVLEQPTHPSSDGADRLAPEARGFKATARP
jgi:hypothetical protein